jgi:hypothetical protein
MNVVANIQELERRIAQACERVDRSPTEVTIVAVTKLVEAAAIRAAFAAGITHFGENRVQEAKGKRGQLLDLAPQCTWHMVGHLQTNKVKAALGLFDTIDSVHSIKLAEMLSYYAQKTLPILLQVNVSGEMTKSGFPVAEIRQAVKEIARLPRLEIKGLMTIAPMVNVGYDVRPIFRQLLELRDSLGLEHLSMGMSDDYEVAIEEGATIVRIGRAIFGQRT